MSDASRGQWEAFQQRVELLPCQSALTCSKTCQNRVAYKRKKIFVAGVLREVDVKDAPNELRVGLCLNHPRFGLGVVESVKYLRRRLRLKYEDSNVMTKDIPDNKSAQEFFDELTESLQGATAARRTPVGWTEVVDPGNLMLSVRFLSGVRRFRRWEMKDVTFYAVENPRLLADLL